MRKWYYNAEHYPDPTAYYALINIERESLEQRRINRKPRKDLDLRRYRRVEECKS